MGSSSPSRDGNKKYLSCHHLVIDVHLDSRHDFSLHSQKQKNTKSLQSPAEQAREPLTRTVHLEQIRGSLDIWRRQKPLSVQKKETEKTAASKKKQKKEIWKTKWPKI